MNNQKLFILSLRTAIQLFTALRERIESGSLPSDMEGILEALAYYQEYFNHCKETGDISDQRKAMLCLEYIPLMLGTLKWREAKANAIFYCEL